MYAIGYPLAERAFSFVGSSIVLVILGLHEMVSYRRRPVSRATVRWTPACAGVRGKTGFSLVELSIVLVILGLLTGGILTGQNLIRAAELRSAVTEFQAFQTAANTFHDKYFALPGDMTNATDFWGEAASGTSCKASTAPGTCNGNGNGVVDRYAGGESNELLRFWQQLSLAGLIEGTYTGAIVDASASDYHDSHPGVNVPTSRIGSSAGWSILNLGNLTAGGFYGYFDGEYGMTMTLGITNGDNWTLSPILIPEEAWNIDTKIDDGKPARGKLVTNDWLGGPADAQCTTASDHTLAAAEVAEFNLDGNEVRCSLAFRKVF